MKRTLTTAAAAVLFAGLLPGSALASIIELGATTTPVTVPTCPKGVSPANCTIILTGVTALETIRDKVAYPTTVTKAGQIVAFTVGLSRLSSSRAQAKIDIHALDQQFGGTTQVALTVLRRTGKASQRKFTVVAQSKIFHVQPYLGQVIQIPLPTSLPVVPGEVVALTTPTWAPVLSIDLTGSRFAYRQSRSSGCSTPPSTSAAQLKVGGTAQYSCNYPGTRVEYSATEITNPVAINPIHAPDLRP